MSLAHFQAELADLDRMIRECPADDVVGRISLEARRRSVEREFGRYLDRAAVKAYRRRTLRRAALAVCSGGQFLTYVASVVAEARHNDHRAIFFLSACLGFLFLNMAIARGDDS